MKNGFWSVLGRHIIKVHSMFGFIVGLTLSFLVWKFSDDREVPLSFCLILAVLSMLLISALISALLEALKSNHIHHPNIERVMMQEEHILVLLSQSKTFSHGIAVSLYYTDEHQFENLICIGKVRNIQENGKIQIMIQQVIEGQGDIIDSLVSNDKAILKKIAVKPVVSTDYLF